MNWMKQFQNPPREYSAVPLWFWNGTLEPDRLRWQIDEMVDKGIYGAFKMCIRDRIPPGLQRQFSSLPGKGPLRI